MIAAAALLVASPAPASDRAWREHVARAAVPLAWQADAPTDDLDALAPVFDAARVVAIGESTHGTREFRAARDRLTRWLVEERGFTLLLPEMTLAGSAGVRRFVQHGEGDPSRALDDAGGWVWHTAEDVEAVRWWAGRRLAIAPIDVQDPHGDLDALVALAAAVDAPEIREQVAALDAARPLIAPAAWLAPFPAGTGARALAGELRAEGVRALVVCSTGRRTTAEPLALAPATWTPFTVPLPAEGVQCSLRVGGDGRLEVRDLALVEGDARRPATIEQVVPRAAGAADGTITARSGGASTFVARARAFADHLAGRTERWAAEFEALARAGAWGFALLAADPDEAGALRDEALADQVARALARAGPEARAVVWAHTAHVRADEGREGPAMGAHLRQAFGEAYLPIALLTSGGTYRASHGGLVGPHPLAPPARGSVEAAFDALAADTAFVDLRPARDLLARPARRLRNVGAAHRPGIWQFRPWRYAVPHAFDALWWIRETRASEDP